MLSVDLSANFAIAGRKCGGKASVGRAAISGSTRRNIQARLGRDSAFQNCLAAFRLPQEYLAALASSQQWMAAKSIHG